MAFNGQAGPSSQAFQQATFQGMGGPGGAGPGGNNQPDFDIFEWYPHFQSCHRYFLDHAQHSGPVQALSAFVNIVLPYQKTPFPVMNSASSSPGAPSMPGSSRQAASFSHANSGHAQAVSLIPYIRRLVATGLDFPGVLHGFFGDDWAQGIGPLHEQERRNYLFAAKSGGWASVKSAYDMSAQETIPFLRPLQGTVESEIEAAEKTWSEWLAMEDWMVGPRSPESMEQSPRVKREPRD
jgi:hypothetical protein